MKSKVVKIIRIAVVVLAILSIAPLLYYTVQKYQPNAGGKLPVAWVLTYLVGGLLGWGVSYLLHPLFHETGHMLFGKMQGMKLLEISFLGCSVVFGKKRKFDTVPLGGGKCVMLPKKTDHLKRRVILYALGGIVGSLAFLGVWTVLAVLFVKMPYYFFAFISCSGVCAVMEILSNLLPSEGVEQTDGSVLFGLLSNAPSSRISLAVMKEQSVLLTGATPKAMNEEALENLPVVIESDYNFLTLLSLRASYFMDCKDMESLEKVFDRMEELLDYFTEEDRLTVRMEMLYFACITGKKETIDKTVDVLKSIANMKTASAYRVRATYEVYVKDNLPLARSLISHGLEKIDELPVPGLAKMEEEQLLGLRKAIIRRENADERQVNALFDEKAELVH